MSVTLFTLSFETTTLEGAVRRIVEKALAHTKGLVVTPNVDHIVLMRDDPRMRAVFGSALFVYADGMPLVWLSRLVYGRAGFPERVAGADLLPAVCAAAAATTLRVYFLGGAPGVAEKIRDKMLLAHPGLHVAGVGCPPIGFEHDAAETTRIIEHINSLNVDVLFIGVGTPKQEKWAHDHLARLRVGPILCVGAAFDFAAGTKTRAPRFIQQAGFEWLWRLVHEPRRLWRRYLVQDRRFFGMALAEIRRLRRAR